MKLSLPILLVVVVCLTVSCGRSELYWPGSASSDLDSDSDGDTDSDSDSDSDGDSDGDTDSETDSDTLDEVPLGFRAVWGSATDDVWVGGVDVPMMHWNGSYWEEDPWDGQDGQSWHVFDIGGRGDVVAASGWEVIEPEEGPKIFEGRAWLYSSSSWWAFYTDQPDRGYLGIWFDEDEFVYMVGLDAALIGGEPTSWYPIFHDVLWFDERPFYCVTGYQDRVFVGGARDTCLPEISYPCGGIVHWNGTAWSELVVSGIDWGEIHVPLAMDVDNEGTLYVAARDGVFYSIGTGWSESYQLSEFNLRGVWARTIEDVWTVGEEGFVARWDGVAWTLMPQDDTIDFYDVWGSQSTTGMDGWANDVYAVGAIEDEDMPIIMHFDGDDWMVVYPLGA